MAVDPKTLKVGDKITSASGRDFIIKKINLKHDRIDFENGEYATIRASSWWWENATFVSSELNMPGLAPDTPTTTNDAGGKQSAVPYRSDLIPPKAILLVANVLHDGAKKYGDDNWHVIPTRDHINHAMTHVFAYLAGDTQDKHLEHAATRLLMALEIDARGGVKKPDAQQ